MIIKGDLNGDGKISLEDICLGRAHILKAINLDERSLAALDINSDGKYSSADLFYMNRHQLAIEILTEVIK